MKLLIVDDYDSLSVVAAQMLANELSGRTDLNLVPATGNTPMGCYSRLAAMARRGGIDPRPLRVIQLDEYVGIPETDDRSLYGWMHRSLIYPLNIAPDRVIRFNTAAPDPAAECIAFDQRVGAAGSIDVVVLGLGPNGHLGYNEPPSDATSPTRVVPLTGDSLTSAAAYFGGRDRVPTHGMTLGMDRLLSASYIMLLVSGASKRDILHQVLYGSVTPDVPASYLQQAARVTILADRAALPEEH